MGWAARKGATYAHRVWTCGRLLLTRVPVTPLDAYVQPLTCATHDGWWTGRVVRLPTWTRVRTGLGVAVSRDVANVSAFLLRLLLECTVVALAVWLAVSSVW